MKRITTGATLAAIAVLMAACSSTPPAPPPAPPAPPAPKVVEAPPPPPPPAPAPLPQPAPASKVATVTLPAYLDPNNPISRDRSVFFDYDQFAIKSEFAALVERHGRFLAGSPKVAVKIEGNTDERGSAEYNLALGQRRADALKVALKVYGAQDAQIEATSWGEEKPRATGHDEAAWSQNRRADVVYPAQ